MKNIIRFLPLAILLVFWSVPLFVIFIYAHDLPNNIEPHIVVSNSNISNRQFNSITTSMTVRTHALRGAKPNTTRFIFLGVAVLGATSTLAKYAKIATYNGVVGFVIALFFGVAVSIIDWWFPMPSDVLWPIQIEMAGLHERHQYTDHTFQISLLRGSYVNEILVNVVDSNNQVVETLFFDFRYGIVLDEVFNIVSEVAPDAPTLEKVEPGFSLRPQQKHLISNQSSLG